MDRLGKEKTNMKRWWTLFLSLALMAAMAVPAAADLQPPLWEQLQYASLEDCLDWTGLTEEQYASIAAEAEDFDPDAYFTANYGEWFASPEEYMAGWSIDEEAFRTDMLRDWFWNQVYPIQAQAEKDEAITAVGGVPGQINVMYNGSCLSFPGVVPEIVDGRTMVPLRSAMEYLGATVTYDHAARTATIAGEGISLTHVIGSQIITLTDGSTVEMDVPSYLNGGSTMVPLRFFSEALGWDVYWDADYRTAVLLDGQAIADLFDEEFTVINSLMAKQYEDLDLSRTYESTLSFSGSAKVFNTIDGDETYRLSGAVSMLFNSEAMELTGEIDLSVLAALMEQIEAEGEALPQEFLDCLSPLTFEMIFAGEQFYLSAPLFTYFLREEGYSVPTGDLWYAADTGEDLPCLYQQLLAGYQEMTIGSLLYLSACAAAETGATSPFLLYSDLWQTASVMVLVYGDDTFTQSGSTYKWHFGEEEYMALQQVLLGLSTPLEESGVSQFSMDMTIRADGSCTFDMEIAAADPYTGASAFALTLSGSSNAEQGSMTGRLQVRNVCDVTFDMDTTFRPSSKTPAVEPPEGAVVIDDNFPMIPVE